jgi:PadR family transcriptional regulator PadR
MKKNIKILTRVEELLLLAVHNLREDAYLVTITDYLGEVTGKKLALPSIHRPLDRLHRQGLLTSEFGKAAAVRGGRRKKIYRITKMGYETLSAFRRFSNQIWQDAAEASGSREGDGR